MKINDKKGVSTIVTVVLLILVSITAVALIAAFVIPFIKGSLNESQECFVTLGKIEAVPGQYTCYSEENGEVSVRIKRGFADGVEVSGLAVVLSGDGKSRRYDITTGLESASIKEYGGEYESALTLPAEGEESTYVIQDIDDLGAITSAQISAVMASDRVCEPVTVEIPACAVSEEETA
jgi:hypothetical protein